MRSFASYCGLVESVFAPAPYDDPRMTAAGLFEGAYSGDIAMMAAALEAGADIDGMSTAYDGYTAVMIAMSEGRIEAARWLLDHGAGLGSDGSTLHSCLRDAYFNQKIDRQTFKDVSSELESRGLLNESVFAPAGDDRIIAYNRTALWFDAVRRGDTAVLKRMLDDGWDIETPGAREDYPFEYDSTAFEAAVRYHDPDTALWLMERGARTYPLTNLPQVDYLAKTTYLMKPQWRKLLKAMEGKEGISESVFAAPAMDEPRVVNHKWFSLALLNIESHYIMLEVKKQLKDGQDIDAVDHEGCTLLYLMLSAGKYRTSLELLKLGADPDAGTYKGETSRTFIEWLSTTSSNDLADKMMDIINNR